PFTKVLSEGITSVFAPETVMASKDGQILNLVGHTPFEDGKAGVNPVAPSPLIDTAIPVAAGSRLIDLITAPLQTAYNGVSNAGRAFLNAMAGPTSGAQAGTPLERTSETGSFLISGSKSDASSVPFGSADRPVLIPRDGV